MSSLAHEFTIIAFISSSGSRQLTPRVVGGLHSRRGTSARRVPPLATRPACLPGDAHGGGVLRHRFELVGPLRQLLRNVLEVVDQRVEVIKRELPAPQGIEGLRVEQGELVPIHPLAEDRDARLRRAGLGQGVGP